MSHSMQGEVDDHDVSGEGTCLTTMLIAYAQDCRKDASMYRRIADALIVEACRAEAAATAAEMVKPEDCFGP